MKVKKLSQRMTFNLKPDLKKKMEEESLKLNISLSDFIRESIEFYLNYLKRKKEQE